MRKLLTLPITLCLLLVACSPLEQQARNTAAALGGAITAAQQQNQAACQAAPTATVCQVINRAVAAQNALITATEAYCGWSPSTNPATAPACTPVKSATSGLQTAISNATPFINQLKGVIQ